MVAAAAAGARLDHYLAQTLAGISRKAIKRALDSGQVFVDGRTATRAGMLLAGGECVELSVEGEASPPLIPPLSVLYHDDSLLAINKPANLPVHPTVGNRLNALDLVSDYVAARGGEERPILLHRLDADTTGLLLFALTSLANRSLSRQFSEHQIEKTYLALVSGHPPARFAVTNHLKAGVRGRTVAVSSGGLAAQTDFTTLACNSGIALVKARPRTGRTHQIRTHLASQGYPLLGDTLYGGQDSLLLPTGRIPLLRHLLHASALVFSHPLSGKKLRLTAPIPEDFCIHFNILEIDTNMVDFVF